MDAYEDHILWSKYPKLKPSKPGRYLVYRESCDKLHFETWNGTGWAYNDSTITYWTTIVKPT